MTQICFIQILKKIHYLTNFNENNLSKIALFTI